VGRDAAELETRLPHRFLGAETTSHQVCGAGFEMKANLCIHVFFEAAASECRAQP
jgi:hypothetical protein